MRRRFLILAGLLALTLPLQAQTAYKKFEQVTVATTSIGLTASALNSGSSHGQANVGSCRLETAEIRWTIDGTVPTTTVGTLLEPGDTLVLTGNDVLNAFRAIRTGSSSGQLDCTYTS